jgi:hypothetical protein
MSRTHEDCGCEFKTESNGREVWTNLCAAHDAEHKQLHEEAQRQHNHERKMRELEEEFT